MKITNEVMEKARSAENSEALWAMAKENGMELTQEEANAYFDQLHKTGELSDEELENVTGGGCHKNGHPVVTICETCKDFQCRTHWKNSDGWKYIDPEYGHICKVCRKQAICKNCYYCHYESALWLCYHPKRQR